jgi:hypothetical protein
MVLMRASALLVVVVVVVLCADVSGWARFAPQAQDATISFEVASIRPAKLPIQRRFLRIEPGGRLNGHNVSVLTLIYFAVSV